MAPPDRHIDMTRTFGDERSMTRKRPSQFTMNHQADAAGPGCPIGCETIPFANANPMTPAGKVVVT